MTTKKPDLTDPSNPWGSKYKESMCLELIEMFSRGKTRANFCGHHTIASDTFDDWRKRHKLFDRAYEIAHQKARDYYDDLRQEYLVQEFEGASINWGLFNRMYNTRFNIPDKRLITVKTLGKAKTEREMLKSLMKAVSEGELTPDEAQKLASLIDVSLKIKNTEEMEARLKMLEDAHEVGFNDGEFKEVPDQ